ncbi:MAG: prephenate dehydratase [Candidatus Dormibacteria bacterium]
MLRVGYQGEPGAYSDEAAEAVFPSASRVGFPGFRDVFAAVGGGTVDAAVLPVENSLAGAVQEVSDLLWEHPGLQVSAERVTPIEHLLLGTAPLRLVRRVLSHPQALAQCAGWIEARGLVAVPVADTAGAARQVATAGIRGDAAIAGIVAARLWQLRVLARDLANDASNRTRFVVVRLGRPSSELAGPLKLALGLTAAHQPGALARVLETFAGNGVNLTRLDSRPIPDSPFQYRFYVDGELAAGRVLGELLGRLRQVTAELLLFGAYPGSGSS